MEKDLPISDEFQYRIGIYDESFDLMQDPLPDSIAPSFLDPVRRARRILKTRTSTQVDSIIRSLNPYLDNGGGYSVQAIQPTGAHEAQGHLTCRVNALRLAMDKLALMPLPDVSNLAWADCFAALSLVYVAEQMYEINNPASKVTLEYERMSSRGAITKAYQAQRAAKWLSDRAAESTNAVAYAEQLQHEAIQLDQEAHQLETKIHYLFASTDGRAHTLNYQPLKQAIFEIFDLKYRRYSNLRAALLIWKHELSNEQKAIFRSGEPEITIAKWIDAYLKRGNT